ncbi:MAG: DUF2806 domain-containing protein [Acetobacter peroxydans]|jgi:hypothetical protein|nr:DUF2806 domain-containing protein [Acetobacter peroxydans]MCI2079201.1 DUF2806 domain-containing protein [Acetobacter peroxydans]
MAGDLVNLLGDAATAGGALGYLNILPSAAKDRLMSGCSFLVGRWKRRVDLHDKREDAEIADEEKRAGNKTTAEQKVLDALVPDIAKRIAGDEALMRRALVSVMGEAYRKQENKEAVVKECLKDIEGKEENVSSNLDPLDKDWLDIFSSYAEKANTERTRQLWGRILSGEVRNPGQFSLKTLRLLSEIDKETANLFVEKARLVFDGYFIIVGEDEGGESFRDYSILEDAGILYGVSGGIELKIKNKKDDLLIYNIDGHVIEMKVISEFAFLIYGLTRAAQDLLNIIDVQPNTIEKIKVFEDRIQKEYAVEEYKILEVRQGEMAASKVLRQWKREK